jgi:hypothetical protein
MNQRLRGLAKGVAISIAILAVPVAAYADTNKEWCVGQGGTWKGADDNHGICSCEMVSNVKGPKICESVGGQTITHGGISQCAVSSERISQARQSSAFKGIVGRAIAGPSVRVTQRRNDMP